jgi:hypothetical protein
MMCSELIAVYAEDHTAPHVYELFECFNVKAVGCIVVTSVFE